MNSPQILVIDDDQDMLLLLQKFLSKKGYSVAIAATGAEGVELLKKHASVELVFCDFKLPDYSGLDILKKIKIINYAVQVIIITGYSDVKIAVDALKEGARDYVTKPLYPDEVLATVKEILAEKTQKQVADKQEASAPAKTPVRSNQKKFIVGSSPQAQKIMQHIALIAPTDFSVIIQGETGTGKEYVANAIHQKSKRADKPFIAIDCGALPQNLAGSELFGHVKGAFTGALADKPGCFELANGGTIFLDEIGNLSYENQVKLLRVLQERKVKRLGANKSISVDFRVIVATNENLKKAISEGEFREDIYHRLNEFSFEIPPLRERKKDISTFAIHFMEEVNQSLGKSITAIAEDAQKVLENYHWPGNLRELKNIVKRGVLLSLGNELEKIALPEEIQMQAINGSENFSTNGSKVLDLKTAVEQAERKAITDALLHTKYNKSKTAEVLKIDRKTLYNKMRVLGMETS